MAIALCLGDYALYRSFDTLNGLMLMEGTEQINFCGLVAGQVEMDLKKCSIGKILYLCTKLHLISIMLLYLFLQASGVMEMLSSQFQKFMKQHSILLSFNIVLTVQF